MIRVLYLSCIMYVIGNSEVMGVCVSVSPSDYRSSIPTLASPS